MGVEDFNFDSGEEAPPQENEEGAESDKPLVEVERSDNEVEDSVVKQSEGENNEENTTPNQDQNAGVLKSKPDEVIKAQIAAFAAEKVEDYKDREYIFKNLGRLAGENVEDKTRITEDDEYPLDEEGKRTRLPKGTERVAARADDYKDYLRSVGGSRYEGIEGRAEILKSYRDFGPAIEKLKGELAASEDSTKHQAYLGSGLNSQVFAIEKDDKRYAVRVPGSFNPSVVDSHIAGAFLGKGVPHLEQIVAASYEDGVTVAEIMPGKEMGKLSVEDLKEVTDKQLEELVDTLIAVNERGIEIDPKPSNYFYDRDTGFGIVDYHSSKVQKNSKDQKLGDIVSWVATPIRMAGFYGKPYRPNISAEEFASDLEYTEASLEILRRYKSAVAERLHGEEFEETLKGIDEEIESFEKTIQDYSDPEWVAEQVAKNIAEKEERRKKRAERKESDDGNLTMTLDIV